MRYLITRARTARAENQTERKKLTALHTRLPVNTPAREETRNGGSDYGRRFKAFDNAIHHLQKHETGSEGKLEQTKVTERKIERERNERSPLQMTGNS